jgi:hypothetical protein
MIDARQCVICDGEIRRLRRATVAPFLAWRIWTRRPFGVDLVQCRACGFLFYNPRLDTSEESRLYADYRSAEYQKMRHASEPWYTPAFNEALGSPDSYDLRRPVLSAILRSHIGGRKIARILDYGGDRGDLVRGLVEGAAPFVYEISGVAPVPGVIPVTDPVACRADLIVNSNVLEHVGYPRALVSAILQAAPPGGLVFLEVPCESPFGAGRMLRRLAQIGIMVLTRPRLAPFVVRPSSLYMMHEHINYFNEETLSTLMRSCGASVVASGRYPTDGRAGKGEMVWCLGTAGG